MRMGGCVCVCAGLVKGVTLVGEEKFSVRILYLFVAVVVVFYLLLTAHCCSSLV